MNSTFYINNIILNKYDKQYTIYLYRCVGLMMVCMCVRVWVGIWGWVGHCNHDHGSTVRTIKILFLSGAKTDNIIVKLLFAKFSLTSLSYKHDL